LKNTNALATASKIVAAALAVVLVSGASIGAITVNQFQENITTVTLKGQKANAPAPDLGSYEGGFNFLLVGSDTRTGQGAYAGKDGGVLNDVTMLLHVSEDQTNAVAVSIPRDMVVPIPSCPKETGTGSYSSMSAMPINNTLEYGGLPCTVLTVEKLTGLSIPFAALITFQGVIDMTTAVGGVPVCINGPLKDKYTGIDLPAAGTYTLSGFQALAFLRSRHGVGDGSDLGRISSQQVFLSSLIRTIKSNDTLTNVAKLYGLAQAATTNMTLSSNLTNPTTMVTMALVLKGIPLERISFVQYPSTTGVGGVYSGKVAPLTTPAAALIAKIKADQPFTLDSGTGRGSVADTTAPSAPAASAPAASAPATAPDASAPAGTPAVLPGVLGQTAADYTCSKVNN
jgi:LCP family protein required for cell wall assembly